MLTHLTIRNYALIRHLEVTPSEHLNVITGETGAGKSIMLGAIGLLLGNRADTRVLWDEKEKCITEGTFDITSYSLQALFESENLDYEETTVIRREISPGGKSRAFINDTPVTLEVMKKIGSRLMDIHSQHETLELGNRLFQLQLIDTFAGNHKIRAAYDLAWKSFQVTKSIYEDLLKDAETLRQESDYVRFQLDELAKADLQEGEQEALETQLKILEHAEDIKNRFNEALARIGNNDGSATSVLADVRSQMNAIASFSPAYQVLLNRLESARIELQDIADELEKEESKIEFDPSRTEEVKERLSLIYQLLQKHRLQNIGELLALKDALQLKADRTNNLDNALQEARLHVNKATQEVESCASELTKTREKVSAPLCKQMVGLLKDLGIPEARMSIERDAISPGLHGAETIEILFSANKGIAPKPLSQVASGGEFSRLMFCVKYLLAEKSSLPTLILDEIDSGVSGEIAIRLGAMMKSMSERHQIIAITHLPQIAAKGDTHYFVYKDSSERKTITHIRELDPSHRVEAIAKMIGGDKPTALALENARELMAH